MLKWLILGALLFIGCSTKKCGIDEDIFKTLPPQKRAEICASYVKEQQRIEKLREERALIEAKNRQLALKLELKKVAALYQPQPQNPYNATKILDIVIINGFIKNQKHPIIPQRFHIARGEAKKICLTQNECIWITYQGAKLLINIEPTYDKRDYPAYVATNNFYKTSHTIALLPRDWFKGEKRVIRFKDDYGRWVEMEIFIRYTDNLLPKI